MATKITVIGGGSSTLIPGLIDHLVENEKLQGSKVILMDVDPNALETMVQFGRKVIEDGGVNVEIQGTTDRRKALNGANFVITTFGVGGIDAWRKDWEISRNHGIYHGVADSVGPSGISRALRHIPIIVDVCKDMEKLCPKAWLINYSNPLSPLCYAISRYTNIKAIGLCTCIEGIKKVFAEAFKVSPDEIQILAAGINHLTWLLDFRIRGEDVYPLLKDKLQDFQLRSESCKFAVSLELYELYGCFPTNFDPHIAEFFPFFYGEKAQEYELRENLINEVGKEKTKVMDKLRKKERPPQIEPEMAMELISAMLSDENRVFDAINIPNKGCIPNLPSEAIVEIPAIIGSYGYRPVKIGELPKAVTPVLYSHIIEQGLIAEAALKGDKKIVLQALLQEPSISSTQQARNILEEILETHARYLPRFNR